MFQVIAENFGDEPLRLSADALFRHCPTGEEDFQVATPKDVPPNGGAAIIAGFTDSTTTVRVRAALYPHPDTPIPTEGDPEPLESVTRQIGVC